MAPQRPVITTTLPSTQHTFRRPQRLLVVHTMAHIPDLGRTITFLVKSTHHQLSIVTLTIHILLSLTVINISHLSWNIVRSTNTHRLSLSNGTITSSSPPIQHSVLWHPPTNQYHAVTHNLCPHQWPLTLASIRYHEICHNPNIQWTLHG